MIISNLLTSYLNETDPPKKQSEFADEINEVIGWHYLTRATISYWVNSVHLPHIKTARVIYAKAPPGKLRDLFSKIIKVLELQ